MLVKLGNNITYVLSKRRGKLLGFGQDAREIIPKFRHHLITHCLIAIAS